MIEVVERPNGNHTAASDNDESTNGDGRGIDAAIEADGDLCRGRDVLYYADTVCGNREAGEEVHQQRDEDLLTVAIEEPTSPGIDPLL